MGWCWIIATDTLWMHLNVYIRASLLWQNEHQSGFTLISKYKKYLITLYQKCMQHWNNAIGIADFAPGAHGAAGDWCRHLANSTEHNVVWLILFNGPQFVKMASSTKHKALNILRCCQRKTEPRPQVTCTKCFVKFRHVIFATCELTDRQTDKQTDTRTSVHTYALITILHTRPGSEVIKQSE